MNRELDSRTPRRRTSRRRRISRAGAAIVVISIMGGGLAWASIPDPSGEIHACYQKESGALRVLDSATTPCKTQEVPLSWSQAGPVGPQGVPGPPGPAGPAGPEGPAAEGAKTIAGRVYASGASTGNGFTIDHVDNYSYDVIFPAGTWNGITSPAMTVTGNGPEIAIVTLESWSFDGAATFMVRFWNPKLEVTTNSDFYFIAAQI